MEIENLRILQKDFIANIKEIQNKIKKLEKLRKTFIKRFTLSKIKNLVIDEYVTGKENSFCYWIENKLRELGSIKGGSTADKKFGVYYGKTKYNDIKKYRFIKKWGNSYIEAFNNVKEEIIKLLDSASNDNLEQIIQNKLSPMFKGKILSTYYPEKFLNIFSYDHLVHFYEILQSQELKKNTNIFEIRNSLKKFKNNDDIMKDWSLYEFSSFLYLKIGSPVSENDLPEKLKKYADIKFPNLKKLKSKFIDIELLENNSERTSGTDIKIKTIDFEKRNSRNIKLGNRGEEIVKLKEIEYLKTIGKTELAKKVEHSAKKYSNLGYDILSFDKFGNKKYIEVKSTTRKPGLINFIITDNEFKKSKELDNYYVYIVFEAQTEFPKIVKLKNPFILLENSIEIKPLNYKVNIYLKEN